MTETPPPSKRPRRSSTLPKPKKEAEKEAEVEPKSKKVKSGAKKNAKKVEDEAETEQEEEGESVDSSTTNTERPKKISSDSAGSVVEEFVDADYLKGEYIAVRTDGRDFYLAEVLQDVLEKDNADSFKIQWFDVSGEDNVYVRSYEDTVDSRSVVCPEVKLKKESGNRFRLKKAQLDKIKRRIKRALQGNPLTSSDDDDVDEDRVDKAKPLKLPGAEMRTFSGKKKKKFGPRTPVGNIATGSPKPFLAPFKDGGLKMVSEPKKKRKSNVVNQQDAYKKSPQRKSGRPPIHDTEYRPNDDSKEDFVKPEPESMETDEQDDVAKADPDQSLKPNLLISLVDSDPAFLASGNSYNLPTEVIAIKCIIQRDIDAFTTLTETGDVKYNLQGYRCADMPLTVLHYALQSNDTEFVRMILSEISAKSEPEPEKEKWSLLTELVAKNDSDGESGNKAFIRPTSWSIDWRDPDAARELASYACREGCQNEILDLLMENYPKLQGGITFRELLIERVYMAVECGHLKTAHYLIECANKQKPSPCQFTDLQRQTLVSTMDRDVPYNVNMKAAEVRRKEPVNKRITAIHTAACNANGQFLKRLLEMVPEGRNQKDERDRKPLHYAAAAYSTEPLLIILKTKRETVATVDEMDKYGLTPLMIAARLGRVNNCKVLLEQAKKTKGMSQRSYVNHIDCHNYTALHYAAENGHDQVIPLLKETGADLNKPLSTKNRRLTPLMLAAKQGHLKTAESLIENGAKLEARDKLGRTALMHAALNGHYTLVALCLNKGVDPNGVDNTENTALHYAAAYGWYHVGKLLLQGGASPDMVNSERISPLSVAVLKYHDDVAQLLFNHGADPNLADNQKRTLLMLLASQKPSDRINERISYLVEHFSPSATVQDIHGFTVVHHLAQLELNEQAQVALVATAKLLIDGGADLNIKDYASRTALFHAVKNANLPLVQFFLEKGAQCPESRAIDQNGENLLHLIVRMWQCGDMAKIIDQLSQPPQPLNGLNDLAGARSKAGYTPMLLACKLMAESSDEIKGQLAERGRQLLDVLVEKAKSDTGATVAKVKYPKGQTRDPKEEGRSPAHYLATSPNADLLSSLLAHSPRLDVLDSTGLTPLTSALLANQNHAACALLEAAALPNFSSSQPQKHQYNLAPLVFASAYHGRDGRQLIPAIKTMLEKIDNKVNEVVPCPTTKKTALMFARDPALVKILLKKSAKVSAIDAKGRSALHHAVLAESQSSTPVSQVIELLLADGADPYQADENGQTAFHLAFLKANGDPMELLALLTQGTINQDLLNKGDKDGNTALHIACSVGSMASILHLHSIGATINLKNGDGNTPLSLAIKNKHEAATVLLVQLGAELNTSVCYKCDETEPTRVDGGVYWRSSDEKRDAKTRKGGKERDSIEVVISHKWRNVMTLMLSRLLKRDEGMDQDYDLDRPSSGFNFARCVQAACTVPDLETALILVRRQKDAKEVNELNEHQQTLLHILAINSRQNQPELKEIAELLIKHEVPLAAQDSKVSIKVKIYFY